MTLTAKREAFAQAYVVTGNASEAYRQTYSAARMKDTTIARNAYELVHHSNVSARIAALQAEALARAQATADDVLSHLTAILRTDMTQIASWGPEGMSFIPSDDLPAPVRFAIQSVKVKRRRLLTGSGDFVQEWEVEEQEVKLKDSTRAAELLGKWFKLWTEKHEHTGAGGGPIQVQVEHFDADAYATLFNDYLERGRALAAGQLPDPEAHGV
ncbi:MAG: terminase small subunit [Burkholderiaceae bacterium]